MKQIDASALPVRHALEPDALRHGALYTHQIATVRIDPKDPDRVFVAAMAVLVALAFCW